MKTMIIDSGWTMRNAKDSEWLPAKVPGSVYGDLLANGKMADPYWKDNEIDAQYIDMILEDAVKNLKPDTPMDQILSHIYQRMILYFGKPETIAPAEKNPKVIFFVGTTGVGKTTTIAKIASDLVINGSKRVALFTCDTYRIAAVEQLRTYASILELPLTVVYDNDDLMNAIKDSSNYDYILVDTAGHSHLDSEKRAESLQKQMYTLYCLQLPSIRIY